jgi:hypothetical protein
MNAARRAVGIATVIALAGSLAAVRLVAFERAGPAPAAPGAKEESVRQVLHAQPFVLGEPYRHDWRREGPAVSSGWLLVLAVDPAYVEPRQTLEPVLYVGSQTAERVNHGFESGRVVAIVPGAIGEEDLARAPMWFGAPELPERVDAARIAREREEAAARGVMPLPRAALERVRARTPAVLELGRREDLDALAGALVLEHSPAEYDLANGLLVPPLK